MMDMLKAYAHQVASYLPAKQRDDVFAETYDNLCEEFSDLQAGDPSLTESAYLTNSKGHPMRYATRLEAGETTYLIGPRFYFSFLAALKMAMSIVFIVYLVIGTVGAMAGGNIVRSFIGAFMGLPLTMLWVAAAVLGVFVAMEKGGEKASWLDKWDAGELARAAGHDRISRAETSFDLAFSTVALLLVLDIVSMPSFIRHDGVWFTAEWSTSLPAGFWWLVILLLAFDVAFSLLRFTRSVWTDGLRLTTIVANVVWLGVLAYAIRQPDILQVDQGDIAQLLPLLERVVNGIMLVVFAIIGWDTAGHVRKLLRGRLRRGPNPGKRLNP